MNEEIKKLLREKAEEAWNNAYAPYSNFAVGAALLTDEGKIFTGCNIENASYGLTICAERVAVFKAVSEGHHKFKALLLITDTESPVTPCGACRQVINEFDSGLDVILTNFKGEEIKITSKELLPGAFNKGDLNHEL